jgi:hypothetical protein
MIETRDMNEFTISVKHARFFWHQNFTKTNKTAVESYMAIHKGTKIITLAQPQPYDSYELDFSALYLVVYGDNGSLK